MNPADPSGSSDLAALRARVQQLEESHGYADRRVDELSDEIIELNKRLEQALRRLTNLEGRLEAITNPDSPDAPEPDAP